MIARYAVVVALVLAIAGHGVARADDASDEAAFTAAAQQVAQGDAVGARAAFEALAARAPTGRWADDALAEAAALAEQAGALADARALWGRIVREHGDGRLARRAQARLDALVAAGGRDGRFDAVAATHERLLREAAGAEDPHGALRELGALLDAHLDYPRWFTAAQWLAEAWARIAEHRLAATWIARAVAAAPGPRERFRAELAWARLDADRGAVAAGLARAEALVPPDATAASARAELIDELRWRQQRAALRWVAAAALLVLAAITLVVLRRARGSWRGAWRALWPPPIEVVYLVPVAAGIALVAHGGNPLAARAVRDVAIGAVLVAWGAGAVARAWARPRWWAALGFVAAVVVAIAAVAWLAVVDEQLLDLLIETWRSGHDGR